MNSVIYARWARSVSNWGDVINPILIEKISGSRVKWINTKDGNTTHKYIVVGSTLQWADEYTTVWGAGMLSADRILDVQPYKICAVRGPLTRDIILKQGFDCPEIYGDPVLLYPRFYKPIIAKQYKLGIIPHHIDSDNEWVKQAGTNNGVLIINILDDINKVVDEILSCDVIASSSLHGIIAADAYGIPSVWIELSDKVLGNGFKFRDYFASVGRTDTEPLIVNKNINGANILLRNLGYNKIDIDLDKLYNACPFKKIK